MFEKLDPRKEKQLRLLDEKGTLSADIKNYPKLTKDQLLSAYEYMLKSRVADEWAVSLQRQGRMATFPPSKGQEANAVGAALALHANDWFVQSYRETSGLLARGVPLSQIYLYFLGNEEGNRLEPNKFHATPYSVPIASQLLHAVGLAYAERYKKTNHIALGFVGDGGTSEGDFHEACNFAGVWNVGAIIYIQNNHYAISCPRANQTRSKTLAEKAFAYGFEGIQIDGNDIFAVYAAITMAAEKARNDEGPTLIEGITYRMGAHTTSDDPKKYRSDDEVKEWEEKDPLSRVERYLLSKKYISEKQIEQQRTAAKEYAKAEFEEVENRAVPTLEDSFRYMYKEMPPILKDQMDSRLQMQKGGNQ